MARRRRPMAPLPAATREAMIAAAEVYYPCALGLHVCGIDEEGNGFYTEANYPAPSVKEAERLFDLARAECGATGDEPTDFVVDLNLGIDVGHVDDFSITRQMLARLDALMAREAAAPPIEETREATAWP